MTASASAPLPIGTVTWREFAREWSATLREDFSWSVPGDDQFAETLGFHYEEWPTGPSRGIPGYDRLADLARRKKGTVAHSPRPAEPPGVAY